MQQEPSKPNPFAGNGGPRPKVRQDDMRGGYTMPGVRYAQPIIHEPTDEDRAFVLTHVKVLTHQMLADRMGISISTLKRHYRKELFQGRSEVTAALGSSLIKQAMAGNLDAMKFYLRTQGGWATRNEVTGADGEPVEHRAIPLDLSNMTEDQINALIPVLEQLLGSSASGSGGPDGDASLGADDPV